MRAVISQSSSGERLALEKTPVPRDVTSEVSRLISASSLVAWYSQVSASWALVSRSWYVRRGDLLPSVCWMFGPLGTLEATGASPRPSGTRRQSTVSPSRPQLGPPVRVCSRSVTRRVAPPPSLRPVQSSLPPSVTTVTTKRAPSGDHEVPATRPPPGSWSSASGVPSVSPFMRAERTTRVPKLVVKRAAAWGSMRMPARRSIGRVMSSMEGSASRWVINILAPSGLMLTDGAGAAVTRSTISWGGRR